MSSNRIIPWGLLQPREQLSESMVNSSTSLLLTQSDSGTLNSDQPASQSLTGPGKVRGLLTANRGPGITRPTQPPPSSRSLLKYPPQRARLSPCIYTWHPILLESALWYTLLYDMALVYLLVIYPSHWNVISMRTRTVFSLKPYPCLSSADHQH